MERPNVDIQRRDVDYYYPLEHRDVAPNVATLENLLSGTSRRCPERRDVDPNVATLPCFKAKHIPF